MPKKSLKKILTLNAGLVRDQLVIYYLNQVEELIDYVLVIEELNNRCH